ncbi:MAG: hypothetical protein Q4D38_01290 [Planctomycetia bacterium]|nr:hypothetical protein [Planctomycetia bacterium]
MKICKFWPGLEYLRRFGSIAAWVVAMIYAFFASGIILTTLFWTEVAADSSQTILLVLFAAVWLLGVVASHRCEKVREEYERKHRQEALADDTLPLAQTAYLRRNFYEAERLLRARLDRFSDDVQSRLLLVSVLYRQQRIEDAKQQIALLEQNSTLGAWRLEVYREKQLLYSEEPA